MVTANFLQHLAYFRDLFRNQGEQKEPDISDTIEELEEKKKLHDLGEKPGAVEGSWISNRALI